MEALDLSKHSFQELIRFKSFLDQHEDYPELILSALSSLVEEEIASKLQELQDEYGYKQLREEINKMYDDQEDWD